MKMMPLMSRKARPGIRAAALLSGLLALAGCSTTQTDISSKQQALPVKVQQSLFVISRISSLNRDWDAVFAASIGKELAKSGLRYAVQSRSPLAVQADRNRYNAELDAFRPEAILVVEPGEGTVDWNDNNLMRRFEAGLFSVSPMDGERTLIWRASIMLKPAAFFIEKDDMAVLARNLGKRLQTDGIIRSTTPPPMPKPLPTPY